MYYPKTVREQKVKELKGNKEFIEYVQKKYETYKRVDGFGGYNTFEDYLVGEVFDLYENFTMLELVKKADEKTINRALDRVICKADSCDGQEELKRNGELKKRDSLSDKIDAASARVESGTESKRENNIHRVR